MAAHAPVHLQFVENQYTCPQTVMLSDGTWVDAPYMRWDPPTGTWKCLMCSTHGSRVTADHVAAPRHQGRTEGQWNQLAHFTRGWQHSIVQIHTDINYTNPPQQQLALPAPQLLPVAPGL